MPAVSTSSSILFPRKHTQRVLNLLARDGNLTKVGAPEKPLSVAVFGLIVQRRSFSGSPIAACRYAGDARLCGEHNITADAK